MARRKASQFRRPLQISPTSGQSFHRQQPSPLSACWQSGGILQCRRVKNWQAWGWGCANGYCLLYLSGCHMGMKRGEMPFLHLICWLNSYYVLGTVPSILHTLSNFMPIAGNQARVLLSPSWRKERKLKGAEHLAERAAAVALPWGQPLGLHRLSSLIACERLQGWPSTKTFWAPEWYAGVTHLSF